MTMARLSLLCVALAFFSSFNQFVAAKKATPSPKANAASLNRTVETSVSLRTHSLHMPYVDSDLQNRWFSFGSDAYVNTNKHIRLTRGVPSQCGWVWSRLPITTPNFRIEVEFKISGKATHLYGDGMAFWLTTTRATPGPVFCAPNNFEGLAVFIDTYANSKHAYAFPRVQAMLGDGKTEYNVADDGATTAAAACSARVRRTDITTKIRLTYFKDDFLQVQLQYKGFDEWTDCFVLRNVSLPAAPYLGVTAQTGDVFDEHDLIAIQTHTAILVEEPTGPGKRPSAYGTSDGALWSIFVFILKALAFLGLCAGAFHAYRVYGAKGGGRFDGRSMPRWQDSKRF